MTIAILCYDFIVVLQGSKTMQILPSPTNHLLSPHTDSSSSPLTEIIPTEK